MTDDSWTRVAAYGDRASAEAILGLLSAESIPCYIASNEFVPGIGSNFAVCVPSYLKHRANGILEDRRVPEGELTELALSEPRQEPDE